MNRRLFAWVLLGVVGLGQLPAQAADPSLKDVYAKDFLIGTALANINSYSAAEKEIIKAQYNVVTPENSTKPQPIHPDEDRWNFGEPDALVKFCTDNNIKVIGHTLLWHGQTPDWFFTDNGQTVSREKLLERMKTHIATVVGHFKGKMKGWDVVNEAINDGGGGRGENLRQSNWEKIIGDDYFIYAFKYAHEADPKADLHYNDYNIESGGKHTASMALLKRLITAGVPITSVGIQGHWGNKPPYDAIEKAINDYAGLGLKVMITELDVNMSGVSGGQLNAGGGGGSSALTPEVAQQQADAYAKLFQIFHRHRDVITRVTFWGVSDRRSWRAEGNPLIFDGNNVAKPALFSIAEVVAGPIGQVDPLVEAQKNEQAGRLGAAYVGYVALSKAGSGGDRAARAAKSAQGIADKAAKELADAEKLLTDKNYVEASRAFSKIAATYAGSDFGKKAQARLDYLRTDPTIRAERTQAEADAAANALETEAKKAEDAKDYAAALRAYETYIKTYPKAAHFEAIKKHYDELMADADIQALVKTQQMDRDCRDWLATAEMYLAGGQPENAKPFLQKVIDTYPDSPYAVKAKARMEENP